MNRCMVCGREAADGMPACPHCGAALTAQDTPEKLTGTQSFVDKYLIFIILGILYLFMFSLVVGTPFFRVENILNIVRQGAVMMILGTAATLSARAKGPDLSLGTIMALSAYICVSQENLAAGIAMAVLLSALIGAINGVLSVYLRMPPVLVTLGVSELLRPLLYIASDGQPVSMPQIQLPSVVFIIFLCFAVMAIAFVLIFLTSLGKPVARRTLGDKSPAYFVAYIVAGEMAGIAGVLLLLRIGVFIPTMGSRMEVFLLLIWAIINASSLFDNKIAPVLVAAIGVVLYQGLSNALILLNVSAYAQMVFQNAICVICLTPALLRWWWNRKALD